MECDGVNVFQSLLWELLLAWVAELEPLLHLHVFLDCLVVCDGIVHWSVKWYQFLRQTYSVLLEVRLVDFLLCRVYRDGR